MRPLIIPLGLCFCLVTGSAARGEGLPPQMLTGLKDATVFIKVGTGREAQSGSGFLIRVDGDTGYVVTNHHVITIESAVVMGSPLGLSARTRRVSARTVSAATVVFHSGTKTELTGRGEVVADDATADLAVLKVAALPGLPKPIDPAPTTDIAETMPVYALGFPFGNLLAVGKDTNPAITVSRAAVSSIRADKQGDVSLIQLDNTLNPGNSGGPVVDERGRLVGVAVARIRDSNIGMAIPAAELRQLLLGRVGPSKLAPKISGDGITLAVELQLIDPFGKLRTTVWHYRPASAGRVTEAPNGLAALPGGRRLDLSRAGAVATGEFSLTAAESQSEFLAQVEYVNGEGKRTFTSIKPFQAKASAPAARVTPAGASAPRLVKLTADDIPKVLADLKADDSSRQTALALLGRSRPVQERQAVVAQALEPLLKGTDESLAAAAVKALGRWATAENVPALTAALESQSVVVRWAALDAIGYFPNPRTAEATAKRLCMNLDRFKASQALQQMGAKAEIAVAVYLTNADIGVRLEACRILKMIGSPASAAALRKAADDPDNVISQAADEALRAAQAR